MEYDTSFDNMKTYLDFFHELTQVPRPSHHEELVADYLCRFAEEHHLVYRRDAQNCVVIEKPASPGYEQAAPVVILNHMDMVCVAEDGYLRDGHPFDPLHDVIRPYVETDTEGNRWMKAEGTSLGADNGIGLSMALAILADDTLAHPALEVLTTTNEEDGMSGAEALSRDFIRGRRVINLDSEAYDEMTVGAAGACLQVATWYPIWIPMEEGFVFRRLVVDGGLGGHSGVDIHKGRCNCIKELGEHLYQGLYDEFTRTTIDRTLHICALRGGSANASIASAAEAVIAIPANDEAWWQLYINEWNKSLSARFADTDPAVHVHLEQAEPQNQSLINAREVLQAIRTIPFGVIRMRQDMPDTVMTSNNIGVLTTSDEAITLSTHTRSFDNHEQMMQSSLIHDLMMAADADDVKMLMNTGAWMEREDSPLLALTCQTFRDVLGFEPKKVAMHFVLEAAYYVEKYPGIEMASIGPRIIEPHSTSERVNLNTADDIWRVTVELLKRLK